MNNNLLTTAYFNEENLKDSDKFYLDCFLKLKKPIKRNAIARINKVKIAGKVYLC